MAAPCSSVNRNLKLEPDCKTLEHVSEILGGRDGIEEPYGVGCSDDEDVEGLKSTLVSRQPVR